MKTAEKILAKRIIKFPEDENHNGMTDKDIKRNVVKSMKEYAKQQAVGFINWRNNVKKFDKSIIRNNPNITTEQLYEEYLKTL